MGGVLNQITEFWLNKKLQPRRDIVACEKCKRQVQLSFLCKHCKKIYCYECREPKWHRCGRYV